MTTSMRQEPATLGVAGPEADLWATYAAVRTLSWLGRLDAVQAPAATARFLMGRHNSDGGYAWTKGMLSDAWATFYCTQALSDLAVPPPDPGRTGDWLADSWSGDAFAMTPGQSPDVWATHFSVRTAVEVCGTGIPDGRRLRDWLAALQTPAGGLTWSPEHAADADGDVRACFYGIVAWHRLNSVEPCEPPWDVPALLAWLRDQRTGDGGYRFGPDCELPCLWATFRATSALTHLGAGVDDATVDWVLRRRGPGHGFTRWPGHAQEDVWATFCAVGSLRAAGVPLGELTGPIAARVAAFECQDGGFTYREPELATDLLSTAAAVLTAAPGDERVPAMRGWLAQCQLPNEGGLMYMPGRGAEMRCTLWGLAAGVLDAAPETRHGIVGWLRANQNPDGGFGQWQGRASDMMSTAAAVESVRLLGASVSAVLDVARLRRFLTSCRSSIGYCPAPGAQPTLRAGLQALRVLEALGVSEWNTVAALLEQHRTRGGGFANTGNRVPDLLSTYEAVVTADRHRLPVDLVHLERFVTRVTMSGSTAWSPLAPTGGGRLADCLGSLLRKRLFGRPGELPGLVLS